MARRRVPPRVFYIYFFRHVSYKTDLGRYTPRTRACRVACARRRRNTVISCVRRGHTIRSRCRLYCTRRPGGRARWPSRVSRERRQGVGKRKRSERKNKKKRAGYYDAVRFVSCNKYNIMRVPRVRVLNCDVAVVMTWLGKFF